MQYVQLPGQNLNDLEDSFKNLFYNTKTKSG